MNLVVTDANVLIDLVKLQLLPHFFSLNMKFYSTDLILNELHVSQQEQLQRYIDDGTLEIVHLTEEEMVDILILQAEKRQLSEQDCSAIICAKKVGGNLLTSDNNLRKFATKKMLIVYGHLWVLDRMVEQQIISGKIVIEKLRELSDIINPRLGLPKNECESRILFWKSI